MFMMLFPWKRVVQLFSLLYNIINHAQEPLLRHGIKRSLFTVTLNWQELLFLENLLKV